MEKLEKEFIKSGGTWKKFYLSKFFQIERGSRLTIRHRVKGNIPLVTAGYENMGIAEYIGNKNQQIFKKNVITIDMFANTFYRGYRFCADDNILVLTPKMQFTQKIGLFISSLISTSLKNQFSYGMQYRQKHFHKTELLFPILNGNLAFSFMERYIEELEAERIEELEAYLKATGLKNYKLSQNDVKTLDEFNEIEYIPPPPPRKIILRNAA